jgi:site-specific DNA-methyltransferase (adenine-specific)
VINQVLHGDCLELMRDIPDGSIDMILCDLPYGTTACKWDVIIPFDLLWAQYKRIVKPNAAIVLTASQPFTSQLVMSNPKWFRYEWIWDKKIPSGMSYSRFQPMRQHESVLIFSQERSRYFPFLTQRVKPIKGGGMSKGETTNNHKLKALKKHYEYKQPTSLISFDKIRRDSVHPTQKPVALFEYLIKTYTNEGDLILDNCAGSGTTAVAAINTNRNYILMEKEAKYIEVINQRLGNHEPSPVLTFPPQPQQLSLFA